MQYIYIDICVCKCAVCVYVEPTCGWKRNPGAGRMYLSLRVSNGSLILLFSTLLIIRPTGQLTTPHSAAGAAAATIAAAAAAANTAATAAAAPQCVTGPDGTCRWGP